MFVITEIMIVTVVMVTSLIDNFGITLSGLKVTLRRKFLFVGMLLGVGVSLVSLVIIIFKNNLIVLVIINTLLIFVIFAVVSHHVFLWSIYFRFKKREEDSEQVVG